MRIASALVPVSLLLFSTAMAAAPAPAPAAKSAADALKGLDAAQKVLADAVHRIEPDPPVKGNAYAVAVEAERRLPCTLWEAAQRLKASQPARAVHLNQPSLTLAQASPGKVLWPALPPAHDSARTPWPTSGTGGQRR